MKKLYAVLLAALSLTGFGSHAQTIVSLEGKVSDANGGAPLEYATAALRQADSTVVAVATTSADGSYRLSAPSGEYVVEISLLGYISQSCTAALPGTKDFSLEPDREMLNAATVTERTPLMEMKIDKLVMNVGQSAFSQGSNGLELIKKAPGVTIDKDGNIKLNGKSVAVWIDGRPSYLDGESLQALLRSTSGDSIEKFEIMEHPSSKYDAAGHGGIINIKTKKNLARGLNGSLGFDGGGMYFGGDLDKFDMQASAWANVNCRTKKNNTFVNIYGGDYDMGVGLDIRTIQQLPVGEYALDSRSLSEINYKSWQVKAGNDWFINDRNIFGVILTFPGGISTTLSDPSRNTSTTSVNGAPVQTMSTMTDNGSRTRRLTGNLNYTHVFNEARSAEMTVNLDWYRSATPSDNRLENDVLDAGSTVPYETMRSVVSDNLLNIYSAKLDYQTVMFNKAMVEAGFKWATSMTDSDTDREETGVPVWNTRFGYREHIGAVYASAALQLNPKWSLKAGLRGEYTGSYGNWITAGTDTERNYFDLFPTLYLGYNPSEKWRHSFSYTRRINRPGYWNLNPVEDLVDAHTTTVGNPDLLPEYSNDINISSGYGQHLYMSLGYNHTGQMSTQVPVFKENGDQQLKVDNFGKMDMVTLSGGLSALPLSKWLQFSLHVNGMYISNVSTGDFRNESFTAMAYSCLSFILPSDWKVELDGRCNSPMAYGYFETSSSWVSNLGVKKNMLDNRLILSINVDDIFRSSRNDVTIVGMGTTTSVMKQKYYSQCFHVGLSWNFGHAQQTRYRKVGQLDEASRSGGGSSSGIGGGISGR